MALTQIIPISNKLCFEAKTDAKLIIIESTLKWLGIQKWRDTNDFVSLYVKK